MVIPFLLAGASLLPTAMAIGGKVGKFYNKLPGKNFKSAVQFGLGYGGATAVGYNLVPQWNRQNYNTKQNYTLSGMYGYQRRGRYPSRYGRRYGSRYSRYSRTSRYSRRSYYGRRYY